MSRKKRLDPVERSKIALRLVIAARRDLIESQPFFGVLSVRLKLVEDNSCETMWVDGVHMGYNPDFVIEIAKAELKGVVCHEVLHVALKHPWRRGKREPGRWNEACDYAINPMVLAAKYILPRDVLFEEKYVGRSAEMIYAMLEEQEQESEAGDSDKNEQSDEQGDNQQQGSNPGDGDEGDEDSEGEGSGEGDADSEDQSDAQGKPGKGKPKRGKPKRNLAGEVRDCPAEVDAAALEAEWTLAVSHATMMQTTRGSMAGNMKEIIDAVRKPRIDWVSLLHELTQQYALKQDYTWSRYNRRYLSQNTYLPSLHGVQLPGFAFARDTSISVPMSLISQAHAEINAIKDELNPEVVHVIDADTRVAEVQELYAGDDLSLEVKGRGGTDLRAPYKYIEDNDIPIAFMIHMTDMDGPLPTEDPGYPVLFLTPPGAPKPPFGVQIELSY